MKLHYLRLRGTMKKYLETYEDSSYASAEALADKIQVDDGVVAKESFSEMLDRIETDCVEENPLFWNPRTRRLEETPTLEDMPLATLMEIAISKVSVDLLRKLSTHENDDIRVRVARNNYTHEDDLWNMSQADRLTEVRMTARQTFRGIKEAGG